MNPLQQHNQELQNENGDLKIALKKLKQTLDRTMQDYKTLQNLHNGFKQQFEELRQERNDLDHRIKNQNIDKQDQEMEFDSIIRQCKDEMQQKQFELEELQQRMQPNLDNDMIRVKLQQELEIPHKLELEQKEMKHQSLQDTIYDMRRQNELLKTQNEILKIEVERDLQEQAERHKMELKDLKLQIQISETSNKQSLKNKDLEKRLKCDLDDLKARNSVLEDTINSLRRDIEFEKQDKSRMLETTYREMDKDKTDLRKALSQNDQNEEKIKNLEQQLKEKLQTHNSIFGGSPKSSPQKHFNHTEQSINQGHQIDSVDNDFNKYKEREKQQKTLYKRIQTLQQQLNDDHEQNKRNTKRLENQIDVLKKEKRELEDDIRRIRDENNQSIGEERKLQQQLQQEKKTIQKQRDELENENSELKSNLNRLGGNKSFLQQGGNLQDVSIVSTMAMQNNASVLPSNNNNLNNNLSANFNAIESNILKNTNNNNQTQQQQKSLGERNFTFNSTKSLLKNNASKENILEKQVVFVDQQENNSDYNNSDQSQQNNNDKQKEKKKVKEMKKKLKMANAKIMQLLQEKLTRNVTLNSTLNNNNNNYSLQSQQQQQNSSNYNDTLKFQNTNSQYSSIPNQPSTYYNYTSENEQKLLEDLNQHKDRLNNLNSEINGAYKNSYRTYDVNNGYYPVNYQPQY